jgi:hypothetical protein
VSVKYQILCVGTDQLLLNTRKWILSRRFEVTAVSGVAGLEDVASSVSIDLVILCYTLSAEEYDVALDLVGLRWPEARILTLQTNLISDFRRSHGHDAFAGPEALITRINATLAE